MDIFEIHDLTYMVKEPNGKPVYIQATIDGQEMSVPLDPSNRHYAEIMRQVDAGSLVVAASETP